ncbi:13005_t:CDS:2, partial [Funneliformis caledonium]
GINSINSQSTSFIPTKRFEHSATLIDDKLYILGGLSLSSNLPNVTIGKEFFYLDFSTSFDNQKLIWKDLTNINKVPSHCDSATANGGLKNTLVLFGGFKFINVKMDLVYMYDTKKNSWDIPTIEGNEPNRTRALFASINDLGKIYYFGGSFNDSVVFDMVILDTINFRWRRGSLIHAPISREDYGSTILPNQIIVYLGGVYKDQENLYNHSMNDVYLYDTVNNIWTTKRIIIFGGLTVKENTDSLYVLNLTNYVWSIPIVTGKAPSNRDGHRANVIGKYMVISFGNGYNHEFESDILLLDISNNDEYEWTNLFDRSSIPIQVDTPTTPKYSDNKFPLIGAIIGLA